MQQLRLLRLTVALLAAAVVVLVLVLASSYARGQAQELEVPEGYVACDASYLGRTDQGCVEADRYTPKDRILYCAAQGTAPISIAACSSSPPLGPPATALTTGPLAPSGGSSILLPAAALLLGTGVLTYTILRRGG